LGWLLAAGGIGKRHRLTGDDCFIAKAFVPSVDELERLIDDLLPFATTNTALIQSSPVSLRIPPAPA
jgi:Lrp/AsnC family leucine-responsive transcriptional regulator